MDYTTRLQRTIDFIEVNLKEELTLSGLADVACFSAFHFSRIFQIYTGTTIMDYVRARRLASTLNLLRSPEKSLLEIAVEYNFGSRDSFTRAFKRVYGLSPGQCRKLKTYPVPAEKPNLREPEIPNRRKIMIYGLDMKIVELPALKVAGYELRTNHEKSFKEIPEFWQRIMKEEKLKNTPPLLSIPEPYRKVELGFCTAFDPQTNSFSYIIGWFVDDAANLPAGLVPKENPPATYAVFTTPPTQRKYFTTVIQLVTRYIYKDWLPASEYVFDERACDLEWYDERCHGEENICMDICVPVKKEGRS